MATGKRFYWLKLYKEFMTGDEIDFLMNQKNGSKYVVLYQMLCLSTINTRGACAYNIGEAIIPYDIDKIQRDTKYFDRDTVIVALELFKKLGWVYEQDNGVLQISNFDEIVGSETDWAQKKARQRLGGGDNVPELSPPKSPQRKREEKEEEKEEEIEEEIDISINHSPPAPACEGKVDLDMISKGERAEMLKQKYIGGRLGHGAVVMNDEQFYDLCERLSLEEIEKYFEIVGECERTGKRYRKKTHYQAILEMVAKDRRCKEDV